MATAAEKQAKADARDLARQSIGQGAQRLATEVPKAGAAFPVRRLRSAGDLSRYTVGGFEDDPFAQALAERAKQQTATGGGRTSGGRTGGTTYGSQTGSGTSGGGGRVGVPSKFGLSREETSYIGRTQRPGPAGSRVAPIPTPGTNTESKIGSKRAAIQKKNSPAAKAAARAKAAAAAKAKTKTKVGGKRAAIQRKKTTKPKPPTTYSRQRAF